MHVPAYAQQLSEQISIVASHADILWACHAILGDEPK